MHDTSLIATEVVVPLESLEGADEGRTLGAALAERLAVPLRIVHVDMPATSEPSRGGADEGLVAAIVAELSDQSILVMHSEHANRWSGKDSIAEHVVDEWGGTAMVVGPGVSTNHLDTSMDSVLVAVDGSSNAERSVAPAATLAAAVGADLVLARVVSHALGEGAEPAVAEARGYLESLAKTIEGDIAVHSAVLESNDPVSALCQEAANRSAGLVVLASRGDRTAPRPMITKTCSGLVAEAGRPVVVIGSR